MAHTTTQALDQDPNGAASTAGAPCPSWCNEHHTVGDHDPTVVREGGITDVDTIDGDFVLWPALYSGPDSTTTEIVMSIRSRDSDIAAGSHFGPTIPEALRLIDVLLETVNRTLPDEQRTLLGTPGFEYVWDDDCGDWL